MSDMKRFIIALGLILFIVFAAIASAKAQTVERSGNNFVQTVSVTQSSDQQTVYTYTIKDKVYPIWITKNGRCYIIKISRNISVQADIPLMWIT